jgi:glycosyltransferase involved in cell wall biosynthesis
VDVFRPDVECAFVRSKYDLGADDFILLFISFLDRSHARKGLGLLLDALAEIKNARIKLIVAGDGNMRAEYQQQAINLGIDRRVVFAGHLPHTELPAYAAACDAVCIPSLPPESFGVALAEGMASGKPVIASDIPGVRSLVQPECGFLIPPGDRSALIDRIQTLAEDHTLRARMGAAGRERILTRYTWRKAAETLRSMYQSVFATA